MYKRQFKSAPVLQTNIELIPVKEALERIKVVKPENIDMKQLDYLVDYYQSGLSIRIEAILRGYGYKENFENNSTSILSTVLPNSSIKCIHCVASKRPTLLINNDVKDERVDGCFDKDVDFLHLSFIYGAIVLEYMILDSSTEDAATNGIGNG